jgi:hypothetical protein
MRKPLMLKTAKKFYTKFDSGHEVILDLGKAHRHLDFLPSSLGNISYWIRIHEWSAFFSQILFAKVWLFFEDGKKVSFWVLLCIHELCLFIFRNKKENEKEKKMKEKRKRKRKENNKQN